MHRIMENGDTAAVTDRSTVPVAYRAALHVATFTIIFRTW